MKSFLIIGLVAISLLSSCRQAPKCSPENSKIVSGELELVGYKIAKHSHVLFVARGTGLFDGREFDLDGLGGKRKPTISIGTKVPCQFIICPNGVDLKFDVQSYVSETNDEYKSVNYRN